MKKIINQHIVLYPQMQIQDAVKLIFQSEFGPGHLIEHPETARTWLLNEIEETKELKPEMIELSDTLVRLHLGKMNESHVDLILDAMIQTSNEVKGSMNIFYEKLDVLKDMNLFPLEEINAYLNEYLNKESLVVSHTAEYRELYHPHYRVVKKEFAEKVLRELYQ